MTVYHQTPRPSHVALFISGDGGWNLGVVDMARELAGQDALVAGVDIRHYMKASTASPDKCWDPGTDFAELGRAVEKRFGYTSQVAARDRRLLLGRDHRLRRHGAGAPPHLPAAA